MNMFKKSLISVVILVLLFAISLPQIAAEAISSDYLKFESITIEQGLSQNYVKSIIQDHYGYIWFGTVFGLNRYDGMEFEIYKSNSTILNSISSSDIWTLYETHDGQFWIGTDYGLNIFNPETETFTAYLNDPDNPNSVSNNFITAIYEDSQGILWIGTSEGLNIFNPETETFTAYLNDPDNPNSISNGYITSICEDNIGYLWIGTRLGLNKLDVEKGKFITYRSDDKPDSINSDRILSLYKDAEGILWIGTNNGINKLNFNNQAFRYYTGALYNTVSGICSGDNKTLWLEVGIDLVKFNLEHHTVEAVYPNIFEVQNYDSPLVNAICIGTDGYIWAGTAGSGLARFDPKTNKLTIYTHEPGNENSLPSNAITSVYVSHDGIVWVGTADGLCRLNPKTEELSQYKNNLEYPDSIRNGEVWVTYETSDHDLLFGTNSGVYMLDNVTRELVCVMDKSESSRELFNRVLTIYEGNNGLLWFGTGYGLYCYNPENDEFISHGMEEFLPNDLILGILEDNSGDIWIASRQGLGRLSIKDGIYTKYGNEDGLGNDSFCLGACYKTEEGEFFFGCLAGLVSFYPENIRKDTSSPRVVIKDFSLINKPISFDESVEDIKEITLPYSENSFEIDFVALHYDSPEQNQYAYKLEGFDENWHYCGANESFTKYTNIPSGEYTFRVKASNSDGVWNEEGASLKITITPPFWQEWWFILSLIFYTLLTIVIAIRLRTRALHIRAQNLEDQVTERTSRLAEKTEQLENELNRRVEFTRSLVHELKSPLTSLQVTNDLLISRAKTEPYRSLAKGINRSVNSLSHRIDELLDTARGEIGLLKLKRSKIDLEKLFASLKTELSLLASSDGKILEFDIQNGLPIALLDEERLSQVIDNLVDNALKYTPKGGRILFSAKVEDSHLVVKVRDNGRGIDKEKLRNIFKYSKHQTDDGQRYSGFGLGLTLSKMLVELHGGEIWVDSMLNKGSTFGFTIPISNSK